MRKRRKTPSSTPVQINPAHLSIGDVLFPEEWLNQKARESGFIKRKSRKIHPRNLLASLVEESLRGSPSYNDLASSIDPYSKNDLAAAPELEIMEGDLVLRDRGYLTASEIQRHAACGAAFIYRHKTGMIYLDPETHRPLDLPALLKRRGSLDIEVLMNDASRTRVRLLAAPVDAPTAELRRMKAKKESKGHNPSKAVLELMDWTIFITNIPADQASFGEVLGIYGLRWRIEVIFKAWKSHLKFDVLHRLSARQLRILLKTRLLVIAAASNLYRKFENRVWQQHRRRLSLLKFMNYLSASMARLKRVVCSEAGDATQTRALEKALARYCCYDKRKKRPNFAETWDFYA